MMTETPFDLILPANFFLTDITVFYLSFIQKKREKIQIMDSLTKNHPLLRHGSDAPEIKRELIYHLQSLVSGIIEFFNFLSIRRHL